MRDRHNRCVSGTNKRAIAFDAFEVDLTARELRKRGVRLKLQDQPFQVLAALLEKPGEVVTRGELQDRIWGDDTFVDFDKSLSAAVNKVRQALDDSRMRPRFIETVPKVGYRFIHLLDDREGIGSPADVQAESGGKWENRTAARLRWAWPAALGVTVAVAAAAWLGLWGPPSRVPAGPLIPMPFTSYPGLEADPDFSPDGNQVAFAWNGEDATNFDIYVKRIGPGTPLRLTSDPGEDRNPSWSPDGRWIAFVRVGTGIVLVPPLGGAERTLAEVESSRGFFGVKGGVTWSPDSKWIVAPHHDSAEGLQGLFLISVESGEKTRLTSAPSQFEDFNPAFSPDGRRLAFVRSTGGLVLVGQLHLLELGEDLVPRAVPKALTEQPQAVFYPAWSANGRELVYTVARGSPLYRLWRIEASGGGRAELLEFAAPGATNAKVSRRGERLVYVQSELESNIWSIEEGKAPSALASSTYYDDNPHYSPDGSRIAFKSARSGYGEIWVSNSDGNNAVQLTSLGTASGTPRWSPDGRSIAFDSWGEYTTDIYTIGSNGGKPKRLTDGTTAYILPSWSRDGKWIYFCKEGDTDQIWRIPVDGGQAVQVTKNGGRVAVEAVDGKHLFYTKGNGARGLWKLSLPDGEETRVLESGYVVGFQPFEDGIYFHYGTPIGAAHVIQFLDFASGQSKEIARIEGPAFVRVHLAVSPDRKTILYTQWEVPALDLMLVENFR
jgi:Tol biopolymer transport system component/DNA-binding winged helix-turn-helix (wHTH) protein